MPCKTVRRLLGKLLFGSEHVAKCAEICRPDTNTT